MTTGLIGFFFFRVFLSPPFFSFLGGFRPRGQPAVMCCRRIRPRPFKTWALERPLVRSGGVYAKIMVTCAKIVNLRQNPVFALALMHTHPQVKSQSDKNILFFIFI